MFDFSNKEVKETSGSVEIFNNGEAGKVENVTVDVHKLGVDYENTGNNQPAYKVIFTDSSGASTDWGLYYVEGSTQYDSEEEAVQKQWNKLGHVLQAAGGNPNSVFKTAKEMLDTMAKEIKTNAKGKTFSVFANYGHKNSPKRFIKVRTWTPFIENSSITDSKLKPTSIDQMERLVPDNAGSSSGGGGLDWLSD